MLPVSGWSCTFLSSRSPPFVSIATTWHGVRPAVRTPYGIRPAGPLTSPPSSPSWQWRRSCCPPWASSSRSSPSPCRSSRSPTRRCAATAAAGRVPARRLLWYVLAAGAGTAAVASALGLVATLGGGSATAAFYVGSLGSAGLLVGAAILARRELPGTRFDAVVEALILITLIAALGVWFVAIPGFTSGDSLLTALFLVDLVALALAALAAVGGRGVARVGGRIALGCAIASAGDGLVAVESAGQLGAVEFLAPLLWAAAGAALTAAADGDSPRTRPRARRELASRLDLHPPRIPLCRRRGDARHCPRAPSGRRPDARALVYFGVFWAALLVLVFGRQAYLLVDNRMAIDRERKLSDQMSRRNHDLEALTGLATTMTQTLEEQPIIERGLGVLHLAARSTSSALHVGGDGGSLELHAVAGAWHDEHPWVDGVEQRVDEPVLRRRGGRQIVRLPLTARGQRDRRRHRHARTGRPGRRGGARAAGAARHTALDRRPERARLPREARAGHPRPAHRRLQPALLLRGAREGDRAHRALRIAGFDRDLRPRRLQVDQRPLRPYRGRRCPARGRRARAPV